MANVSNITHLNPMWAADCYGQLPSIYSSVNRAPTATINVVLCDLSSAGGALGTAPGVPGPGIEASPSQLVAVDYR